MTDTIWFALQVRGGSEFAVASELRRNGLEVFVPFERHIRRSRHMKTPKEHTRPMVGGWVFCEQPNAIGHKEIYRVLTTPQGEFARIPHAQLMPLFLANGRAIGNDFLACLVQISVNHRKDLQKAA